MNDTNTTLIPMEAIKSSILALRGQRVILDADLARLYGVETKTFNRAVKRNLDRFPPDFMFQLTQEEMSNLKIPKWHLKFLGWPTLCPLRVHRARGCHGRIHTAFPPRRGCERLRGPGFRANAGSAFRTG